MFHTLMLATFGQVFLTFMLVLVSLLLMGLILLQKNRGSGLSGAFGGVGGHTAFGTKTGDFLTWVTVGLAAVFILLSITAVFVFERNIATATGQQPQPAPTAPTAPSTGPTGAAGTSTPIALEPITVETVDIKPGEGQPAERTTLFEQPPASTPRTEGRGSPAGAPEESKPADESPKPADDSPKPDGR